MRSQDRLCLEGELQIAFRVFSQHHPRASSMAFEEPVPNGESYHCQRTSNEPVHPEPRRYSLFMEILLEENLKNQS